MRKKVMSPSDDARPISIGQPKSENLTDIEVLLIKVADQNWFKQLDSDEKKNYIVAKVNTFCSLGWVKELDDEQRFECFLGYLQYEFLKQGLRRQQQARDFVFYGFSSAGGVTPHLESIGIEVR
jgi:hypothetical protein